MSDTASAGDRLADLQASPLVALALLETLRSTDTPAELLEDEDVQRSLPRRLGLSDAVDAQIRRYRELLARSGSLPAREVGDLFALVSRRPDAPSVFERAGSWLVRQRMETKKGGLGRRLASVPLPRALRERLALRVARQVAGEVNPTARAVRVQRKPVTLVVEESLPAACAAPDACRILLGALRASLAAHSVEAEDGGVAHPLCELRGDGCCLWRPAD